MAEPITEEEVQKQLQELKKWITETPYVPKDIDDKLLLRFLHSCYYDMKKAQTTIEIFSSFRASSPELFDNRDPLSTQVQNTLKIVNLAHITLSGNRSLWIWQLNDPGLRKFDYLQDARLFFLTSDAFFLEVSSLPESDVVIMDVKDISVKIIAKFNMAVAKKLGKYQAQAMPIRLKEIHIVNAAPLFDTVFSVMKQFVDKDITEIIHFHAPKSDTLYKFIPKEELPQDFGGSLPSMKEQMERVLVTLYKHREAVLNNDLWKAPEKKPKKKSRASASASSAPEEVSSFRSLAID